MTSMLLVGNITLALTMACTPSTSLISIKHSRHSSGMHPEQDAAVVAAEQRSRLGITRKEKVTPSDNHNRSS